MSLRILCIGDLHYKESNVEESKLLNTFLLTTARSLAPDLIVILGDILHNHRKLDAAIRHWAIEFFEELGKVAPVRILIGNHDRINNSDFLSPIHPFSGVDLVGVKFIWSPLIETFGAYKCVFVPYVFPGRLWEALDTVTSREVVHTQVAAIFAHQELRGVKMNTTTSRVGDVWEARDPLIVSGHIHQHQRLADNILYVGTPRMTDFGDTLDKTISLLTLSSEKTDPEDIATANVIWREQRLDVPLAKRLTLELEFSAIATTKLDASNLPGRIIIAGTREELLTLKTNYQVGQWKHLGIKIQPRLLRREKLVFPSISPKLAFLDSLRAATSHKDELALLDFITRA